MCILKNLRNQKILVFAPGTIGDTLTALPAFAFITRKLHEQGNTVHLYNSYPASATPAHAQLFQGMPFFDQLYFVPVAAKIWQDPVRRLKHVLELRKEHYDALIDIPCNDPDSLGLLKCFGAKRIYHDNGEIPKDRPRWKFLFDLFAHWGMPYSESDLHFDWHFTAEEEQRADQWFEALKIPANTTPFAMCTGGKCALQHWPLERYADVLQKIVPKNHLFPIFFGGPQDRRDAEFLIQSCGCGIFADVELPLREKILALKKCRFYFGNHTGVMHLAGAAGVGGIAISSARDPEHYWETLSRNLQLVIPDVRCKGCRKMFCSRPKEQLCINRISADFILKTLEIFIHV